MSEQLPFPNTPSAQYVIISFVVKGKGTEGDPVRRVLTVYTLDGEFIAENDPLN